MMINILQFYQYSYKISTAQNYLPRFTSFAVSDLVHENIKQHFQVFWTGHVFRVKLHTRTINTTASKLLYRLITAHLTLYKHIK